MTDLRNPSRPAQASTPPSVHIRPASAADATLVDQMVREIARHEDSEEDVVARAPDWERLLRRQEVTVLLAFVADKPVGYVSAVRRLNLWLGTELIAIDDLWVRPAHRNLGVGEQLMRSIAAQAAPEGATIVWGARLDNEAAHRFYRRLGATLTTKVVAAWTPAVYATPPSPSITA